MDWHSWILLLLQVSALAFCKNAAAFKELKEKRLSFVQDSKCTYSYEVAVHAARGSKSTESDGFQVHALVSITPYTMKLMSAKLNDVSQNTVDFVCIWHFTCCYRRIVPKACQDHSYWGVSMHCLGVDFTAFTDLVVGTRFAFYLGSLSSKNLDHASTFQAISSKLEVIILFFDLLL